MKVSQIKTILESNRKNLDEFGVQSLRVFGSTARDTETSTSDIDMIVEFRKDFEPGMFEFLELQYFLERVLSASVDLATERALHPALKDKILRDAIDVA